MRILILTTNSRGTASRCLPSLVSSPDINVGGVIKCNVGSKNRIEVFKSKIKKVAHIGILGALNGLRLRRWYYDSSTPRIESISKDYNIDFYKTEAVNSKPTKKYFEKIDADIGLSLGSTYIKKTIFDIPKHGMMNVHAEVLPKFRGAQSVLWPIHEGLRKTGFTIHKINEKIDEGKIIYTEKFPIEFKSTLKKTVTESLKKTRARIPPALRHVCENYEKLVQNAEPQGEAKKFTTPSIKEYINMIYKNWKLFREKTK